MCEIAQYLKLCTCSDTVDKTKPYWTLSRKNVFQLDTSSIPFLVGIYIQPNYDLSEYMEEQIITEWTLDQLNARNCFDFDYEPFDEDKLVINLNKRQFQYIFSGKEYRWKTVHEDPMNEDQVMRSAQANGYLELE
jgi:hypothetical protein